jgi:hypothetical protein
LREGGERERGGGEKHVVDTELGHQNRGYLFQIVSFNEKSS